MGYFFPLRSCKIHIRVSEPTYFLAMGILGEAPQMQVKDTSQILCGSCKTLQSMDESESEEGLKRLYCNAVPSQFG